jgi:predicted acetyltransferase
MRTVVDLLRTSLADLRGSLASGVHALLDAAFPDTARGEGAYHVEHGTPTFILICHESEHVVGHLAVYEREVGMGEEALRIGMIGGVTIAPDYRGRGHSRTLLAQAHEHLRGEAIPFSILFAYAPRVYESSGYKLMQNETRFLDHDGAWKTLVYRGSMYAELLERRWPNQRLDLRGRVV